MVRPELADTYASVNYPGIIHACPADIHIDNLCCVHIGVAIDQLSSRINYFWRVSVDLVGISDVRPFPVVN